MIDMAEDSRKKVERALLVGIRTPDETAAEVEEHLDELADLVRNLDIVPLEPVVVNLHSPMPQYCVGTGKAREIAQLLQECEADCLIFDNPLTPSQQRNWERLTHSCVIDREEVILDIFAERASTREAVLQVELARTRYSLPRLTRAWTHLSRQHGGGATTRGEGEAQIETDRRLLRRRIRQLEEELKTVRKQRETQRKSRRRNLVPHGAIVGYTNVGKSSLLQALSGSELLVKDQLFATLDPTTRRVPLGENLEVLLTDTVGFVRKLPHSLVEAFKSTLEEAVCAKVILNVCDASDPECAEHLKVTNDLLEELGCSGKPIIPVFNKCDLPQADEAAMRLPGAVNISALEGKGLDELLDAVAKALPPTRAKAKLLIPYSDGAAAAALRKDGVITVEDYRADGLYLELTADVSLIDRYQDYCV